MKKLLTCIVLLSFSHYASADITFEFKDIKSTNKQHSVTYKLKNHLLKLTESTSKRINIYNHATDQFVSHDLETGKSSMLNEQVLNQRINQLNQKRLKKLVTVEKEVSAKLKTMTADEQKVGESLINILKYPEMYGEHTLLSVKASIKQKQIADINCQVYELYRNTELLKEFCLADAKSLKISAQEYKTFRNFYNFEYKTQSRLMLALGKTDFVLVDYEQQKIPGIIIETISYKKNKTIQHLILKSFNSHDLADTEFSPITKP